MFIRNHMVAVNPNIVTGAPRRVIVVDDPLLALDPSFTAAMRSNFLTNCLGRWLDALELLPDLLDLVVNSDRLAAEHSDCPKVRSGNDFAEAFAVMVFALGGQVTAEVVVTELAHALGETALSVPICITKVVASTCVLDYRLLIRKTDEAKERIQS